MATKLKIDKLTLGEREFDTKALLNTIRKSVKVWSWGAHAWTAHKSKWLRFKSNGHHHKGHVYISLAFNDTFTIHYTTTKGTILDIDTSDIYIDMLIDTIDNKIERIDSYVD